MKIGHQIEKCFSKQICNEDECKKFHHSSLHSATKKQEDLKNVGHVRMIDVSTKVLTKVTLMEEKTAKQLGLSGPNKAFHMQTANGISINKSIRVNISIKGAKTSGTYTLQNVRTLRSLPLCHQTVNVSELATKWEHLRNVDVDSLKNARPTILIGQDHADLIVAEEAIKGPWRSPVLSRKALGWVIHGTVAGMHGRNNPGVKKCNWLHEEQDDLLHQLVKESFSTESFGVKVTQEKAKSKDDRRAEAIMEATAKRSVTKLCVLDIRG